MSRASAMVTFPDGYRLYTLYNGTVDQLWTRLVDSIDVAWSELWTAYKHGQFDAIQATCVCGRDEPVVVWNEYGAGEEWESRACRHCRAVTGAVDSQEGLEEELDVGLHGLAGLGRKR